VSFEGKLVLPIVALGSVTKHGHLELMTDNILFLNMSLVSLKCLFEFWVFSKGVMENEIAVIVMQWRIFRKNVPTSNAEQSCTASLHLSNRLVAHILKKITEECTLQ